MKIALKVIGRWLLTGALLTCAAVIGWTLGLALRDWLSANPGPTLFGVPVSGAALVALPIAYVVASGQALVKSAISIGSYLTDLNAKIVFSHEIVAIAGIVTYVTLTVNALGDPPTKGKFAQGDVFLMRAVGLPPANIRYFYPLAGKVVATANGIKFAEGVRISEIDGQVEHLDRVLDTLHACAAGADDPKVAIRLVGLADANEFKERGAEESARLNLDLANERASILFEHVSKIISEEKLKIAPELRRWDDLRDLRSDPAYLNAKRLTESGGLDQGLFNRAVVIELTSLSGCTRIASGAVRSG